MQILDKICRNLDLELRILPICCPFNSLKKLGGMASGADGDGPPQNDIPRGLVNRTGNPIGRGSRLPSLRGQRDLTLGGIQRKIFKPNLAAVKKGPSKDDSPKPGGDSFSSGSANERGKGRDRGRGRSDRARGRGRGRGEDRTIQLQSEFAFGPIGSTNSGWSRSREGGGGGGGGGSVKSEDGASSAVKTAGMKRSQGTADDKKLLDSLMQDDFISDLSAGDPSMAPIRLPLNINASFKSEIKPEIKADPDGMNIKMEVDEAEASTSMNGMGTGTSSDTARPSTVREIFQMGAKSEKGELLFLQLPDALPGLPDVLASDDRSRPSTSTGNASAADELADKIRQCYLKDCQEGYVGKLRIRKSGKAELVLGDNVMEVLPAIPANFHQELVSIRTDDIPGQMIVLGDVQHKLVMTPDYNHLIGQISRFS